MNDKFGRELKVGDLCLRVKVSSWGPPEFTVVEVEDFTPLKVKIGPRSFVNSTSVILLNEKDLETGDKVK